MNKNLIKILSTLGLIVAIALILKGVFGVGKIGLNKVKDKSKIFVTFRPSEEIKDEVSLTSGHDYKTSSVTASSGKRRYSFFSQKNFAWLLDDQEEKKFIQLMKKATDIIVKARTTKGAETTDHYSMMGFTKAYNTAKKLAVK